MKRLFLAVAMLAGATLAGCGSTSCSDACQTLVSCLTKLGEPTTDVATCTSGCNAGTCTNKQQLIDCVHGTSCNAGAATYDAAIAACQLNSQCSIQ